MIISKLHFLIENIYDKIDKGLVTEDKEIDITSDIMKFIDMEYIFSGTNTEQEMIDDGYETLEEYFIDCYGRWEWTDRLDELDDLHLEKIFNFVDKIYTQLGV